MARPSSRLQSFCLEVEDSTESRLSVTRLAEIGGGRDPSGLAAIRAEALLQINRGVLRDFQVDAYVTVSRGEARLVIRTGTAVGSLPLLSPLSGRPDYGLVIRPRFGWKSVGEVLWQTGLRTVPQLLPLPPLPSSERRVPPWVLSALVINRLEDLIRLSERRFLLVDESRRQPRGRVDWARYAGRHVAYGRSHSMPCRFQDLARDDDLLGAISFVLRRHKSLLQAQRTAGQVVTYLLRRCDAAIQCIGDVEPRVPHDALRRHWRSRPLQQRAFADGLEAIDWTLDERGLAGMDDLSGVPWRLAMDEFFEEWVGEISRELAKLAGFRVTTGRGHQTRHRLHWHPQWIGGLQSLEPDVVLRGEEVCVVMEAKYKRHLDQAQLQSWPEMPSVLREAHRADLHQVLAYSSLLDCRHVVACLVYPCQAETYEVLQQQESPFARARVRAGGRFVDLAIAAAPLTVPAAQIARTLLPLVRPATGDAGSGLLGMGFPSRGDP